MEHEDYMRLALAMARQAAADDEVPVGCVAVCGGRVVGWGRNRQEKRKNAQAHAEMEAMAEASRTLDRWRLKDVALYTTLEPCPMCAGAIYNARVGAVYFGARDRQAGACGGVLNLFMEGFTGGPAIQGGLLEAECSGILADFFRKRRKT